MNRNKKKHKLALKRHSRPALDPFSPQNKLIFKVSGKKPVYEINLHFDVKCRRSVSGIKTEIEELIKRVLLSERICYASLGVVFCGKAFIKNLNKRFLARNSYTDVIAFDHKPVLFGENIIIGDVVICVDVANECCEKFKVSFKEELFRYIIHGILHLRGYDDLTLSKQKKMWKKQEGLVKKYV